MNAPLVQRVQQYRCSLDKRVHAFYYRLYPTDSQDTNARLAAIRLQANCHSRKEEVIEMFMPRREKGAALTEYALILVFVFLVVIAIVAVYGVFIGNLYSRVTNQVP